MQSRQTPTRRAGRYCFIKGSKKVTPFSLTDLGWSDVFARQCPIDAPYYPARISEVHRHEIQVISPQGPLRLPTPDGMSTGDFAAGDWVLTDGATTRIEHLLERQSKIVRLGAGTSVNNQLIAANVDTLAIVTSCNADFNVARLERYLVLASQAGCIPLIILTKSDQTDDPSDFVRKAERLSPIVTAIAMNAKDPDELERLKPWCKTGQTLALVGSSGVGKTTLRNGLSGETAATQEIREDDARGRHTTTSRTLLRTRYGGWIIDTPGMRALRLTDAAEGIDAVFSDLADLAEHCRFNDCQHETEPGCAIQAAIKTGAIDGDRLRRWQKLAREDARHGETTAEARSRDKSFGKMVRAVTSGKKNRRGGR